MKKNLSISIIGFILIQLLFITSCCNNSQDKKSPVDYVNPYMGNISHLLVPTYPTVHLPFSMLRVYPERQDFTSDLITGLPVAVTSHRVSSAFSINPVNGTDSPAQAFVRYTYDNEKVSPYRYSVYLDEENVQVDFTPSHQSALYSFLFEKENFNRLIINTRNGQLETKDTGVTGYQLLNRNDTKIYAYFETEQTPLSVEKLTQESGSGFRLT